MSSTDWQTNMNKTYVKNKTLGTLSAADIRITEKQ